MAPTRVEKELEVLISNFETGETTSHKEQMEVIQFPSMFMIPYDELVRIAAKHKVPRPRLLTSEAVKDCAYWQQSKTFAVPAHEMYHFVTRYYVTVGAEFQGDFYTGEGSAGADNVERWQIKSYGFEMACKRAKARYFKEILGLTQYLSDSEVGASAINKVEVSETVEAGPAEIDDTPDFMKTEAKDDPASENQKIAIFEIIRKIYASDSTEKMISVQDVMDAFVKADHGNDWWLSFATHNSELLNTTTTSSGIYILPLNVPHVFGFMTKTMASEFLSKMGNFSATTVKPGKN